MLLEIAVGGGMLIFQDELRSTGYNIRPMVKTVGGGQEPDSCGCFPDIRYFCPCIVDGSLTMTKLVIERLI